VTVVASALVLSNLPSLAAVYFHAVLPFLLLWNLVVIAALYKLITMHFPEQPPSTDLEQQKPKCTKHFITIHEVIQCSIENNERNETSFRISLPSAGNNGGAIVSSTAAYSIILGSIFITCGQVFGSTIRAVEFYSFISRGVALLLWVCLSACFHSKKWTVIHSSFVGLLVFASYVTSDASKVAQGKSATFPFFLISMDLVGLFLQALRLQLSLHDPHPPGGPSLPPAAHPRHGAWPDDASDSESAA